MTDEELHEAQQKEGVLTSPRHTPPTSRRARVVAVTPLQHPEADDGLPLAKPASIDEVPHEVDAVEAVEVIATTSETADKTASTQEAPQLEATKVEAVNQEAVQQEQLQHEAAQHEQIREVAEDFQEEAHAQESAEQAVSVQGLEHTLHEENV